MTRVTRVFVFIVSAWMTTYSQGGMIVDSIASPAVGVVKKFGVLLPENYDASRSYPVLYLLHGHDGSCEDWTGRTTIAAFVRSMPLIVILPDAENSWYVNAFADPSKRFHIDSTKRGIAGLSMGGYGAILYALKRPDLFQFAGSLSGAFFFPTFLGDSLRQPVSRGLRKSLQAAFGPEPNAHRKGNDVFVLAGSIDTSRAPYIYMAAGIQDGFKGFLPVHRMFADALRVAGIPYEFHETRGGHSWKYWEREIRPLVGRMREVLGF